MNSVEITNQVLLCSNIRKVRRELHLTLVQFAKKLNTVQGYLSEVERSKKKPGSELIIKIKNAFDVNLEWLFTGNGEMFISDNENPDNNTITISDHLKIVNALIKGDS